MLCRQVAEVHEAEPDRLIGVFPMPRTVRLVMYVATRWRWTSGPRWSRMGVLTRDHRRCGYCTAVATTIDHLVPRSQGGQNTWTNTVACCGDCNQRKGDRTPEQAGMRLVRRPATPTWVSYTGR